MKLVSFLRAASISLTPIVFLACGSSTMVSARPPTGTDAGAPDPGAGRPDGGPSDAGFTATEQCPCASYCYFMRADTVDDGMVATASGEIWTQHDRRIVRRVNGSEEVIALPQGDFHFASLFGDDEPWITMNGSGTASSQQGLFKWDGTGWAAHSLPPTPAVDAGGSLWLDVARAGNRLLADYRDDGGAAYVFEGGKWTSVHPWSQGLRPQQIAGSTDVLAVQVGGVPGTIETWTRRGSGAWTKIVPPGPVNGFGLAVSGSLVALPGFVYDGSQWFPLDGGTAHFGGVVDGVPWVVTSSEAIDLSSPANPVRHPLPFGAYTAAFPTDGPLWVGGNGVAYWNGQSFTLTRQAVAGFSGVPQAVTGDPSDFSVISSTWGNNPVTLRRFHNGISAQYSLPVPWSSGDSLLSAAPDSKHGQFFGFKGGVGRSQSGSWLDLDSNAQIDPALDATQGWLVAANKSALPAAAAGSRIYRWTDAASGWTHVADLPDGKAVDNLFQDEQGEVWATSADGVVAHSQSWSGATVGWTVLPKPSLAGGQSLYMGSLYAHGGHAYVIVFGPSPSGITSAVLEWDGGRWLSTPLPEDRIYLGAEITGSGDAVMVVSGSDLRTWRRQAPGDWQEEGSCPAAAGQIYDQTPITTTWWPDGADRPWLIGPQMILKPRQP